MLSPHAHTVPFRFSANAWAQPPETTLTSLEGRDLHRGVALRCSPVAKLPGLIIPPHPHRPPAGYGQTEVSASGNGLDGTESGNLGRRV